MECYNCGRENPEEAIYCLKCGKRLDGKKACVNCGKEIIDESVYCIYCGAKQDKARAEYSYEPKQDVVDEKTIESPCGVATNKLFCNYKSALKFSALTLSFIAVLLACVGSFFYGLKGEFITQGVVSGSIKRIDVVLLAYRRV